MRGPAQLRAALADYLAADLPARFPSLRRAWGLDEDTLPLPKRYFPHEPLALDDFPVVAVVTGRGRITPVADRDADGSAQYTSAYPARLFGWVRGQGMAATLTLRDDFIAALQVTLLASPTVGGAGSGQLRIFPPLDVDYSGVDAVKGDRYVAGGFVGFTLSATETLGRGLTHPAWQDPATLGGGVAHAESPWGVTVTSVHAQGRALPTYGGPS